MAKAPAYIFLGADDLSLTTLAGELLHQGQSDTKIFIFPGDPRDALESFPQKLAQENLELARVVALADAGEIEKRPELRPWLDMLAHFSDVLLLINTREVAQGWLRQLKKTFSDRPLIMREWPVFKNRDSLIAEVIYPEARRLSQYFDAEVLADIPVFTKDGKEYGDDVFESQGEGNSDGEEKGDEEENNFTEEKYFVRDAAGRRMIKIVLP